MNTEKDIMEKKTSEDEERLINDLEYLRKRNSELEKALSDTRKKFEAFIDTAPDIIYRLDKDGKIIFLSNAISDYGYLADDLLGENILDLVHPLDKRIATYRINERRTGDRRTQLFKVRLLTKNKKSVPFEINSKRLNNEQYFLISAEGLYASERPDPSNFIGTLGIARDITDRLKTEEALRASERKYRLLFEESNDAVFIFDYDGGIKEVNAKAVDMLGYSGRILLSMSMETLFSEDEVGTVREVFTSLYKIKGARFETRMRRFDGDTITVEVSASYIDRDKGIIQLLARDITDRKQVEQRLKASLEEKEALLAEIHHRVKNNIQVISSLLKLQAEQIRDDSYLHIFEESINRIQTMGLIHSMLYQSEDFSSIDFYDYVRRLSANLLDLFNVKPGEIRINTEIDDISVRLDTAIPCGLVINELISNSLKHAFPDERKGTITVTMHRGGDGDLELIVKDDGIGMPKDLDWRKTNSLGLLIVNLLVERQLSGKIYHFGTNGTEFIVRLQDNDR